MTSQREGGSTSVLEAMLIGVPIVFTNVGVVPDVIENGINGFVSSVGNYEDLSVKVNLLLLDKNLQYKFIKESKIRIEQFAASKIANQTFLEYKKILEL